MAESAGKMYALATVLSILAVIAIVLRFYARHIKRTALSWDDYTILLALLFTIGTAICMVVGTAIGNLGQHTEMKNGLPIFDHRLTVFEQIIFASLLTQTLTFGFTKISVLLFYKRIFRGNMFLVSVWTMIVVTSLWTFVFFLSNLFQCVPFTAELDGIWAYSPPMHRYNAIGSRSNMVGRPHRYHYPFVTASMRKIWNLQMSTKRKIGISGMFLLGALTVGAGVAKLVVFTKILQEAQTNGFQDISYFNTPIVYWPMVESSLGIVGACLPMLRPLFVRTSSSSRRFSPPPELDEDGLVMEIFSK